MATKRAKTSTSRTPKASRTSAKSEKAAFLKSLMAHGQAAPLRKDGSLPKGATHALVTDASGHVMAVRKRFSAI